MRISKVILIVGVVGLPVFGDWVCAFGGPASGDPNRVTVCSFNIMWLGGYKKKEHEALAGILKPYDVVVVQELVAPPVDGNYPDGEPYLADVEAGAFAKAMTDLGFCYRLSEEDTGTGDTIHSVGSNTEWWIAFYNPNVIACANDIPNGFLAEDRSNHPCYERVPYAFGFRTLNAKLDFVLISVHLEPGNSPENRMRRRHELSAIGNWIYDEKQKETVKERDFIILGDMNIYGQEELAIVTPIGYRSLNEACKATNTQPGSPRPYDHVMYSTQYTKEIDTDFGLDIVDLIQAMRPSWTASDPYPGDPYVHNEFKQRYSDHRPVVFVMNVPDQDDD